MMHTALEGLSTIVIDLNNYTDRKSIPDLDRRVDEIGSVGACLGRDMLVRVARLTTYIRLRKHQIQIGWT